MSRRRWHLQRYNRRILHCEHIVHNSWCGDVLGIHQAGRDEDTGSADEGVAVGSVDSCAIVG